MLSTTTRTPWRCAIPLAAAMSVTDSIGLVGDSMNRYFVFVVNAGAMASSREVST